MLGYAIAWPAGCFICPSPVSWRRARRRILAEATGKWHVPAHGQAGHRIIHRPARQGAALFAKIDHVAIVSKKHAWLASFHESLLGMKRSPKGKINRAITVAEPCPIGEHFLGDPDFTLIAIRGRH
jgi:hypothetical protein